MWALQGHLTDQNVQTELEKNGLSQQSALTEFIAQVSSVAAPPGPSFPEGPL
jgi:hypothetical protein